MNIIIIIITITSFDVLINNAAFSLFQTEGFYQQKTNGDLYLHCLQKLVLASGRLLGIRIRYEILQNYQL